MDELWLGEGHAIQVQSKLGKKNQKAVLLVITDGANDAGILSVEVSGISMSPRLPLSFFKLLAL